MRDERITVSVLTGFLGSGKTTVLRHLLGTPQLRNTAVLINEFGAVGLDHLLVDAIAGEPVLLGGGCVCCTLRGDVRDSLLDLWERRARGTLPAFDRVVIETTGLADPIPVMASVAHDLALRHHFKPGQIVTTVDAVQGVRTLDRYAEGLQQVRAADMLLVTKQDLATPVALAETIATLASLNPLARIEPVVAGAAPLATLLGLDGAATIERAAQWLAPSRTPPRRHNDVSATVIESDRPLDWADFALWFSLLAHRYGAQVLRMKGILSLAGSDTPVLVQSAQHLVHRPEHLRPGAAAPGRSFLVLITDGLDTSLLRRSFDVMVMKMEHAP